MLVTMVPNLISISRVVLMPVIVFLIGQASVPAFLAATTLFTVAALTDFWDGLLARRLGASSKLGAFLDPLADKILVLGILAAFVHNNILPLGLFLIFAARDIFMTALRSIVASAGVQWKTSKLAKWKTFLQLLVLYGGFAVLATRVKIFAIPTSFMHHLFLCMVWPIALLTLYSALDYLLTYQTPLEDLMVSKSICSRTITLVIATLGLAWVRLPAPGTIASALAVGLACILPMHSTWTGLAIAILAIIGWVYATRATRILQNTPPQSVTPAWFDTILRFAQNHSPRAGDSKPLTLSDFDPELDEGEKSYRRALKNQDPSIIVIDEVVAMLFVCFWLQPPTWVGYALGFLFFRLFDIVKPFPINILEQKIKGGLGIMLDDLAAAVLAVIATKIVLYCLAIS